MSPRSALGVLFTALITTLVAMVVALVSAPATWLDRLAATLTHGKVRLAEASGTIWQGSGRLIWADTGESAESRLSLSGVALPGRVHWRVAPMPLLLGLIEATLQIDGMAGGVALQGSWRELRLGNGRLDLPRIELAALGSPWNTVRPAGAVTVSWSNVMMGTQRFEGSVEIELRDIASSLSAVRPLGSYRIEVQARSGQAVISMRTLEGALTLTGQGAASGRGFSFLARAHPTRADDTRLQGLLGLVGTREGDQTIIKIGS
ncbi:MAG: type II secretion system protein N [Betaproteobacteria bacterium]|nr:type II secretion system protein N [Betaproteobacteria bacterium]